MEEKEVEKDEMKETKKSKSEKFFDCLPFIGSVLFILFIILFTWFVIVSSNKDTQEKLNNIQTREIKSYTVMSNNVDNIGDTFILGYWNNKTSASRYNQFVEYYFYMKDEEGFVLTHLNAENVEIVSIKNGTPYIKGHFTDLGELYDGGLFLSSDERHQMMHYTLYLPEGYMLYDCNTEVKDE